MRLNDYLYDVALPVVRIVDFEDLVVSIGVLCDETRVPNGFIAGVFYCDIPYSAILR